MLQQIGLGKPRYGQKPQPNTPRVQGRWMVVWLCCFAWSAMAATPELKRQTCRSLGTVGFHDYGGEPTAFEPTVFVESQFTLEKNALLMRHLSPDQGTYLTLVQGEDRIELTCSSVRLPAGVSGYSCHNEPPTTLFLFNPKTRKYTRSNLAAWTFSQSTAKSDAAPTLESNHSGESMFIEHGMCRQD